MVVPKSTAGIQQNDHLETSLSLTSSGDCGPGPVSDPDQPGPELEEVRKLQELVRRLEIQNQQLRNRSNRTVLGATTQSSINTMEINNSINSKIEDRELQIMTDIQNKMGKIRTEEKRGELLLKPNMDEQVHFAKNIAGSMPCEQENIKSTEMHGDNINIKSNLNVDRTHSMESAECTDCTTRSSVSKTTEINVSKEDGDVKRLDDSTLDEVEVLDLENCSEDEEDSWLYVSPKKAAPTAEKISESPLKWCRQVLDHHSPQTEAACRTLITRLDQGCVNMHSALSSQSSVDSELSTSDDSISMGYKLQDLTDVQIMARLQEESLRQDYASSSASASRRSSSASLNSLRRGTYSDQEFDTYSLEDEDDYDCSLSYRSTHRYSPSPLSSPRCQSPAAAAGDYGRGTTSRIRPPRRSLQGPVPDLKKYTNNGEEMRHSMPNLARTSLRSLESARNSRSLESNLQVPNNRVSRIQHSSSGKLRFSPGNGQSSLSIRQPVKAVSATNSPLASKQSVKTTGYSSLAGSGRRMQSPCSESSSRAASAASGGRTTPVKTRTSLGGTASVPKSKLSQPTRRSLQVTKTSGPATDDSWKDGCY
ncbi:SLAIN motif-containing protein-like isoform X2 [Latimeria chalumnae]|uniref:SLAIN motif-containing protein-like isoform X2 n=1 Tax=Latimeria chalumnae TaxID=7897 RepID=UPI0003C136BE|nr:PREDICTED: SLAIN motif-containing protein-like isoform X2 [Latimeria chalumnae]|eukprot:XP_005994786.1 PREDICTED: SLAIN motif-containing protein-like isoform X2 [Latimeria chalumnae]